MLKVLTHAEYSDADQEFSREMFMEQDKIAFLIKIKCTPADRDE